MTFFPEIDEKQTIKNAKRKLREYPRWRRIAGDVDGQKITASYSFEPRQVAGTPNKAVERLAISKVDALAELEAIEYAVSQLSNSRHRQILYEKYLRKYSKRDLEIYTELFMSQTGYYQTLSVALLEFAEVYRKGCLLVEKIG